MTPKEGGETTSYSGKFLDILVKQADGSWKIAIDCHNYNEPSG
jgi:ketosteroid isomerase-like protein